MKNPRALRIYPAAKDLAVSVYQVTRLFPNDERFGLTAQMRRAAVSIGSNVAEGCGRNGDRALLAFVHIAIGSANELEFQLEVALGLSLIAETDAESLLNLLYAVRAMLIKLASRLRASESQKAL